MGELLNELLSEIEKEPLDEQVKIICDKIMDEEIPDIKKYVGPQGPNIFLSLEVDSTKNDILFLCLERESAGKFLVSLYNKSKLKENSPLKKGTVWPLFDDKAEKVLRSFAKKLKYIKGEI